MPILKPLDAANIAASVYEVETSRNLRDELAVKNPFGLGDMFEFRQNAITKGNSGPTLLGSALPKVAANLLTKSGFGYVAQGKGTFAGEVLVAFRGTNFVKARDVWTDANFSVQQGRSGFAVHGGFNDTFNSLLQPLRNQLAGIDKATPLHFVGHSLGGALATIAMDWCMAEGYTQPRLYTFGSPRVGMQPFSSSFTQKAKAENIYRVHHTSDVVSMIPIFPFVHVPLPGEICTVARTGLFGAPVSVSMHFMENYIESVTGRDWKMLRDASTVAMQKSQAEAAMNREITSALYGRFSAMALFAINDALCSLLGKAGELFGIGLMGGMTILDRIAWALGRLAQAGGQLLSDIIRVMNLALRFMGMQGIAAGKLSASVIRDILFKLSNVVFGMARRSVEAAYRRGG